MKKVVPSLGTLSTEIFALCRSTTRFTMESPIPVPSYSSSETNRLNTWAAILYGIIN